MRYFSSVVVLFFVVIAFPCFIYFFSSLFVCFLPQLKKKSAVSAAFELCAAMEPKTRPKFEFEDKDSPKKTAVSCSNTVNFGTTHETLRSVTAAETLLERSRVGSNSTG